MKIAKRIIAMALALVLAITIVAPAATTTAQAAETNGNYKLVALTFDDGPSKYTSYLLDELAKRNAHCTFFMVGTNAAQRPELLKRMASEGHQLGNHTYSHALLTTSNVKTQVSGCRKYLVAAAGEQTYYIRPPYGSSSAAIRASFNAPAILWSVDPYDWKYLNTTTVVNNIMSSVKDGDIILLHDLYKTSVDAALIVIDKLQAQGYEFVTVSELFRRRGITPQNGKTYTCARNTGVNLGPATSSGTTTTTPAAPAADPEDYDETKLSEHWGYDAIQFVLGDTVTQGGIFDKYSDGSFGPNKYMTRGMFVTALGKLAGIEVPEEIEQVFDDVPADNAAAAYIQWAAENKIIEGYGDGKFGIDDTITREQMATIIQRYMVFAELADEGDGLDFELTFTDSSEISDYAGDGVRFCASIGLIKGDENNAYTPTMNTTRAQAATVFMRLWNYLNPTEEQPGDDDTGDKTGEDTGDKSDDAGDKTEDDGNTAPGDTE